MKKTVFFITIMVVMLVATSVAFAANAVKAPAEIVSDLIGNSAEDVIEARENGETYCEQAADADKLDEFKAERLAQYKLTLAEAVQDGRITQERADDLYAAMDQRMETCLGTGECTGRGTGIGMCGSSGKGQCNGLGMGGRNGANGNCYLDD